VCLILVCLIRESHLLGVVCAFVVNHVLAVFCALFLHASFMHRIYHVVCASILCVSFVYHIHRMSCLSSHSRITCCLSCVPHSCVVSHTKCLVRLVCLIKGVLRASFMNDILSVLYASFVHDSFIKHIQSVLCASLRASCVPCMPHSCVSHSCIT